MASTSGYSAASSSQSTAGTGGYGQNTHGSTTMASTTHSTGLEDSTRKNACSDSNSNQINLKTLVKYDFFGNDGAHGNIYERDLARVLFMRGTLQQYEFKLAVQMKEAGKFDDVVLYVKNDKTNLNETWLFQAKHAKPTALRFSGHAKQDKSNPPKIRQILEKELFPSKKHLQGKDFDLFKYMDSYLKVERRISGKKRFFIFSNKDLEGSENLKKWVQGADVDPLMDFSDFGGVYKRLRLDEDGTEKILSQKNKTFYDIKDAIVNMFDTGKVDDLLWKYKTSVAKLLTRKIENGEIMVGFASTNNDLYMALLEHYKSEGLDFLKTKVTPNIKGLLDKSQSQPPFHFKELPELFDKAMLTKFFESLTFCLNQPNKLLNIVELDNDTWIRARVRPDFLGKLGESQLKLPISKFDEVFKNWFEPTMDTVKDPDRSFLLSKTGNECLDSVRKDIAQELELSNRRYYVDRKVVFVRKYGAYNTHSGISDAELIKQLINGHIRDKCLILIGEPALGKTTTMQYVSFEVQKRTRSKVFLIYLNSLKDKLLASNAARDLNESVLDIIGSALSGTNRSLLEAIVANRETGTRGDIWFFLDGFDEIPASENSKFISVVRQLLKVQRVRIVISGPTHVENDLRTTLDPKVMYLEPFVCGDQIMVLENKWNVSLEDLSAHENFQNNAKIVLDWLNTKIYRFLGMPLIINLLAEVCKEYCNFFLQSTNGDDILKKLSNKIPSVNGLIELYVGKSFCMKMCKKFNVDAYSNNEQPDKEMGILFKRYILEHELAAIEILSYIPEIKEINQVNQEEVYASFKQRIQNREEKTLLINLTEPHMSFVQKSLTEYFVARYLYENGELCQESLRNVLGSVPLVRKFFFSMLNDKLNESSTQLSILCNICRPDKVAFWACEDTYLDVLKSLSTSHDLSTFLSDKHDTLLHVAAQNGSYEICEFLLNETNIQVNGLSGNKQQMLEADDHGHGSERAIHFTLDYKVTALHLAAAFGHEKIVKLLLARLADVNVPSENDYTSLHMATEQGLQNIMKLLTDHSMDSLNAQTVDGNTPLHLAIHFKHVDCAEFLISLGADENISNKAGSKPLELAVSRGLPTVVAKLKSLMRHDYYQTVPALLHMATEGGDLDTVKNIISMLPDIIDSMGSKESIGLISCAVKGGNVDIVKDFVELIQNVHASKTNETSALHFAILLGRMDIAQFLISCSAFVHCHDSKGKTPLHLAAEGDHIVIANLLLEKSVDVNAVDKIKRTALHAAVTNAQMVELLLKHLANPDLADMKKRTPLHVAAGMGQMKAVKLLVEKSKNINALTKKGQTATSIAAKRGYLDIVETLTRSGGHR